PIAVDLEKPHRALAPPVRECIGLARAFVLRKVELEHGLTSVRERRRHGQRDVSLPEGLAEPDRPPLRALLRETRQGPQPSGTAGTVAPPAQPLGNLDQTRSLAMKNPLVPWTSGRVNKNSGPF